MIGVLHVVDTLALGGAERMAVNLANAMPRDRFRAHLCCTRRGGPLESEIAPHVRWFCLGRRSRFDFNAIRRLARYIADHRIELIHAQSTSVFIAGLASGVARRGKVLWHDQYGGLRSDGRSVLPYHVISYKLAGVLAVSDELANWSARHLKVRRDRIWYVPNFVRIQVEEVLPGEIDLPGIRGSRLVQVANLRRQKDHLTSIRALALVVKEVPEAHLLLVGAAPDPQWTAQLFAEIHRLGLERHVTHLGPRPDVFRIVRNSDVGLLSSASEGFPLVLLEYGAAGLAAVATRVGQCPEILDEGRAGLLVRAGDPGQLAQAILALLRSPGYRDELARRLQERVRTVYSPEAILEKVLKAYESVLAG